MKIYKFIIEILNKNPGQLLLYTFALSTLVPIMIYANFREWNNRCNELEKEINLLKEKLPIAHLPEDNFIKEDKVKEQRRNKSILKGAITLIILSGILSLFLSILMYFI